MTVPTTVQIRTLTDAPTVGAPFHLAIEVQHAPGVLALLPQALTLGDDLEERSVARTHERKMVGDVEVDHFRLELIAFRAGSIEIPPIKIAVGAENVQTEPVSISVTSTLDEAALSAASSTRPEALEALESLAAKDPSAEVIHVPDYTLAYAVFGLLTLIATILLLRRLVRRRGKSGPVIAPTPPPRPAHEQALDRLEALRDSDHLRQGAHKEYWAELSMILRAYVGQSYGFDAVELTVEELMLCLSGKRTPHLDLSGFERWLECADMAKYAKHTPTLSDAHAALNFAFDLVEATRPKEPTS